MVGGAKGEWGGREDRRKEMEEREMGKDGKTKRCGRKVNSKRGKWGRRREKRKGERKVVKQGTKNAG